MKSLLREIQETKNKNILSSDLKVSKAHSAVIKYFAIVFSSLQSKTQETYFESSRIGLPSTVR